MNPRGRETKYNPDLVKVLCEHLEDGFTVGVSCAESGISTSCLYRWLADDKPEHDDLRDKFARATARAQRRYEEMLKVAVASKKDPTVILSILKLRYPKDWHDPKREIELSGGLAITNNDESALEKLAKKFGKNTADLRAELEKKMGGDDGS